MHGQDGKIVGSFNIIGALHPFLTWLLLETLQVLFLAGCRPCTVRGGNQALANFRNLWFSRREQSSRFTHQRVNPSGGDVRVEDIKHSVDDVGNEVYVALPSSSSSIHAE